MLKNRAPAENALTMPDTKLGSEKNLAKNPIAPPKKVDTAPKYGPRSMPIIGAITADKVIDLFGKPTI